VTTIHNTHPDPRPEFLVDGCPRCEEYVRDLGVEFDAIRWRTFWEHVIAVEYDGTARYKSALDNQLGTQWARIMVGMERAYGVDPREIPMRFRLTPMGLANALGFDPDPPE
jgi:hypothetical protein